MGGRTRFTEALPRAWRTMSVYKMQTTAGGLLAALCLFVVSTPSFAANVGPVLLSDTELAAVHATGLYFRMDMSIEVFNPGDTVPQVTVNTSNPISVPTSTINTSTSPTSTSSTTSGSSFAGPSTSVALSGNAQSAVSSLVNVVGAGSVINVGVNVVNITNSNSDTLYTTNTNLGVLGGTSSIPATSLNTSTSPTP